MNELFEQRILIYNIRSQTDFTRGQISTAKNGLKSSKYLQSKICNIIPPDIRNSKTLKHLRGKLSLGLLKFTLVGYILIRSVTLGMSISHIFGNRPSEVLWKIERVSILAGHLTMAASALKCYS